MTFAEIQRGFAGVVLLFRGRPEGLALMDLSVEGFWRSFLTMLLVVPCDALALTLVDTGGEGTFALLLTNRLPATLLDYALVPTILAAVARPLGLGRTYVPFVVARNWGAPAVAGLMALLVVLAGVGILGPSGLTYASVGVLGLWLRYEWMAIRLALRAGVTTAVGVLGLDVVVSLILIDIFSVG